MAYCGARRNDTLALRWADVDFKREQLTIGGDGNTKNSTSRTVDFNPALKNHLLAMRTRRALIHNGSFRHRSAAMIFTP